MDAVPPTAQSILTMFFEDAPTLRHPSMRGRARSLRIRTEHLLEKHAPGLMGREEAIIYQAERQLEPYGAAVRTMTARTLLACLPRLLEDPRVPQDATEASAWVQTMTGLRAWLLQHSPAGAYEETVAAVDEALMAAHLRLAAQRRPSGHR